MDLRRNDRRIAILLCSASLTVSSDICKWKSFAPVSCSLSNILIFSWELAKKPNDRRREYFIISIGDNFRSTQEMLLQPIAIYYQATHCWLFERVWKNVWECLEQYKVLENLIKCFFLSCFCNSELPLNRKQLFLTTKSRRVSFISQMLFRYLLRLHWYLWEWFLNMSEFGLLTQTLFNKT